MRLHAIVSDLDTARAAVDGGATVLQLRLKGASTREIADQGYGYRHLCKLCGVAFVVNDDVEAALVLGADGVHLGRTDPGAERAVAEGLLLGMSANGLDEALAAEALGAGYIGAGPVWGTPSKPDAGPAIGLAGLAGICEAVAVPVVAIGGIDATNAAECLAAGAAGVAVVRAAADTKAVNEALAAG